MNTVSIEHILVLICTMIGMNYANDFDDCLRQVDSMFEEQNNSIEGRIKFIIKEITLEDIRGNLNKTLYVQYLFNAISEKTHENTPNVLKFCQRYRGYACFDELSSKGIQRTASAKLIVEHVYYNLKQGNEVYIYDLIENVYSALVINEDDLFGILSTRDFCRIKRCSDSIRTVFPDHCKNFEKPVYYMFYTFLYITFDKDLDENYFAREFLEQLFSIVSKQYYYDLDGKEVEITNNLPIIDPRGFCENFKLALSGEPKTKLAELIIENSKIIIENSKSIKHTKKFDYESCIQEIANLKLPLESFYETAKEIYFKISIDKLYEDNMLRDYNIIRYAEHYIRFFYKIMALLKKGNNIETARTPEQYCAKNWLKYEKNNKI